MVFLQTKIGLGLIPNVARGKGLRAAKKFHGDFPGRLPVIGAWMNKILVSVVLGVLSIFAALSIYQGYESRAIISGLFAGGM